MLPKGRTLKFKAVFERVKKIGKPVHIRSMLVLFLKQDPPQKTQIGIIVSNKIDKLAVNRNRIKRAVREAVRQNFGKIPEGLDIVFIAKETASKMLTEDIMKDIKILFDSKPFV